MIPNKIEQGTVYLSGSELLGIADVELPSFEYESEALNPLGVGGEIETTSPAGLKALTLKLKFRAITPQAVELLSPTSKEIEIYGAQSFFDQNTKNNVIKQLRVFTIVQPKKEGLGKIEPKKVMDTEIELSAPYLVLELDGVKLVEYDPANWVLYINGKNYLEDIRYALGK